MRIKFWTNENEKWIALYFKNDDSGVTLIQFLQFFYFLITSKVILKTVSSKLILDVQRLVSPYVD